MKVSYEEGLANHFGLQRRGGSGDRSVLSVRVKGNAGQLLSSEIITFVCRSCPVREKATSSLPSMARPRRTRRSQRTCACVDIPNARTGRSHQFPTWLVSLERSINVSDGNIDMHAGGKSDDFVVPTKRTNKTRTLAAESAEERKSPKGSDVARTFAPDTVPDDATINQRTFMARSDWRQS